MLTKLPSGRWISLEDIVTIQVVAGTGGHTFTVVVERRHASEARADFARLDKAMVFAKKLAELVNAAQGGGNHPSEVGLARRLLDWRDTDRENLNEILEYASATVAKAERR